MLCSGHPIPALLQLTPCLDLGQCRESAEHRTSMDGPSSVCPLSSGLLTWLCHEGICISCKMRGKLGVKRLNTIKQRISGNLHPWNVTTSTGQDPEEPQMTLKMTLSEGRTKKPPEVPSPRKELFSFMKSTKQNPARCPAPAAEEEIWLQSS